jgi:ribonuclease HII
MIHYIGVDEAGRGPLFGRVYAAAVYLGTSSDDIWMSELKDSKAFSSEVRRAKVAAKIRENAAAWSISYEDEHSIDQHNILQATQLAMRRAILEVLQNITQTHPPCIQLLIDGNFFTPLFYKGAFVPHQCVVKGDSLHPCISAASILAKVARDTYIHELCEQHPDPTMT